MTTDEILNELSKGPKSYTAFLGSLRNVGSLIDVGYITKDRRGDLRITEKGEEYRTRQSGWQNKQDKG